MSAAADATRVTIVVDNRAREGLETEHGFAAWIEHAGQRVLFDSGQGPTLAANARALGVDLEQTDHVVLSHGHYDHGGGLPLVLERAADARLWLHPGALAERHAVRDGAARSVAIPEAARAAVEALPDRRVRWTTAPAKIAGGMGVTGPVPRETSYEDTGGPFFLDPSGSRADPITDDQALWLHASRGLVVVVGCSHAGVINTVRHALRVSGARRLHAVLGGFHLLQASATRLERTVQALRELDPDLVVPCHCTGDGAIETLLRALEPRAAAGEAGAVHEFPLD